MKNIFLIGDSIRFGAPPNSPGYGVYVKDKLTGKANVYAPNENCRFAQFTLRQIFDWALELDSENIDIIHWNNGLWDVIRLHGDGPLTPINVYVDFLERIYHMLSKLFPKAKIIFALSTPVIEKQDTKDPFQRYNKEIEEYNEAAKTLMNRLGVQVNDLYSIAKNLGEEYRSDWVHYNHKGSEILADAVIKAINI